MLQNEWDRVDDAVSRMLGVNLTDLRVMDILERVGPVTVGRLAELPSLSTGAVTGSSTAWRPRAMSTVPATPPTAAASSSTATA